MTCQPGQAMLMRDNRQFCDQRGRERSGTADVDIEAVIRGRDLDIKWLAGLDQRFGDGPAGVKRAIQAGIENRTAIDRNDVVRTTGRKTHFEYFMRAHAPMQGDAAAAAAM